MERYCQPEELTGTLIYLVSEMSQFVTGVVIPVDGGSVRIVEFKQYLIK